MRIIAGKFRGRSLKAPKGSATRPTTDRVREALFAILGDLAGKRVIDCYAGTGALGLEAVSRGAALAVLIEASEHAYRVLKDNVSSLDVGDGVSIVRQAVERSEKRIAPLGPFDLVLADPPWPIAARAAKDVVKLLLPHLSSDGFFVLGHAKRSPLELPPQLGVRLIDQRSWGDSAMSWFQPVAAKHPVSADDDDDGPATLA